MYNGPIRRTNNKYPTKIIAIGNGLDIKGQLVTLGSVKYYETLLITNFKMEIYSYSPEISSKRKR